MIAVRLRPGTRAATLAAMQGAVRLATAADLESLVRLAGEFRRFLERGDPSDAEFRNGCRALLRDANTEFAVATDATLGALGYAQTRYRLSAWNGGVEAELEDLFVSAAARGRGVGRKLLEFVLQCVRARGCRVMLLATNERNREALALYESLGFRAERERWENGRQLCLDLLLPR